MDGISNYIWLGLVGGAAAFAHCLGMCGGFALHLAQGESGRRVLARQLLWHAGKTTTYVFLGALAGFFGGWLTASAGLPWMQNVVAYVAGGVMVFMGLALLGVIPLSGRRKPAEGGLLSSLFGDFLGRPTPAGALALGIATGFLPCPIILGFLALAVQGGSVIVGMAMMAAVGLGTVWSLLVLGMTGHVVTLRLKRWGATVGGVVLVLLGLTTALRGTEVYHRLLGCPPAVAQPADVPPAGPPPCCGGA
jgi:sulfite exporter TauE/SafE